MIAGVLVLLVAAAPAADRDGRAQPRSAQLTIRERVTVVRVPRATAKREAPVKWKEKRGPRCIAMADVAGASVIEPDSVDLTLRGSKRVRAEFRASCPALDYYSGFYIRPSSDKRICADRDAVHARSGGECEIQRFRTLVPDHD